MENNENDNDPMIGKIFFSKYEVIKKLGEGSFGKVYKAIYNKTEEEFAIKTEHKTKEQGLLEIEATIMNYLKGPNIPIIKSFGFSGNYNVLVMQLLDKSLEDLINKLNRFSIKTTAMLGYQMVNILQYIHDRHIIHRDIKPDNFVMGAKAKNDRLYLLDFGLAKKYRSSKTFVQYPYIKKKKLTGTARYASIHALEAYEQSRRDDLESVGYVLIYFLRGNLPWQGLRVRSKEDRYKRILEKKKEISSEELCKNFPHEFYKFVDYTKNLKYEENPDYDMLKKLFLDVIAARREKIDYIYDWTTKDDLEMRKENKKENNSEKEYNKNEDTEAFTNEQIVRVNSRRTKKDLGEEKNDKVESVCCIVYVHKIYNFFYSF